MMNERIKALAAQAWVDNDQLDACGYTDLEKFAELIVQECADISNQAERQCQHPGTQILKHFGVES
jgi:hypothetical protein